MVLARHVDRASGSGFFRPTRKKVSSYRRFPRRRFEGPGIYHHSVLDSGCAPKSRGNWKTRRGRGGLEIPGTGSGCPANTKIRKVIPINKMRPPAGCLLLGNSLA